MPGVAENDESADLSSVLHVLRDERWRVRQVGVEKVIQRGGTDAVELILWEMRQRHHDLGFLNAALQVLVRSGVDVLDSLVLFLSDPDTDLRTYTVLALGELGNERAVPALVAALDDADPNVVYHAIEALGKLRAGTAVERLTRIAESRDFARAFPALTALAEIGDGSIAERLIPLLEDPLLQPAVLETLGRLGDERIVAPLVGWLEESADAGEAAAPVAQALLNIHNRCEAAYGSGAEVARRVCESLGEKGRHQLVETAAAAAGDELIALARVLVWLEGAEVDRILVDLLSNPAARDIAAEGLSGRDGSILPGVLAQLNHPDAATCRAAVRVLGQSGDPQAIPPLVQCLAEPELISDAIEALGKSGDPRATEPLLNFLGHSDISVRRAAVAALLPLARCVSAEKLRELLTDTSPAVREAAVKIAGYAGVPESIELMLQGMYDPEENVRRAAIETLAWINDPRALHALLKARTAESATLRISAVRALGQIGNPEAKQALRDSLNDPDPWARYFAVRGLAGDDSAEVVDRLSELVTSEPAMHVRIAAVEALRASGAAKIISTLIPLVDSEDRDLARAALAAIAATNQGSGLAPVFSALDSSDRVRRLDAIEACAIGGQSEVIPHLRRIAATDNDDEIVRAATLALARIPHPDAVQALVSLSASPLRRSAAVAALISIDTSAVDWLAGGLRHQNLDVRRSVVEALSRIRHPRATELLALAATDCALSVRQAALRSLAHLEGGAGQWKTDAPAGEAQSPRVEAPSPEAGQGPQ